MPPSSDINAAFEAWLDATEACETPEDETALRYRRYGPVVAALERESNYLVLYDIDTDTEQQGRGHGSALIRLLQRICDEHHVTLLAQATAYDTAHGLDQQALLDWYDRLGFEIDRERTAQPLVWYPRRPR